MDAKHTNIASNVFQMRSSLYVIRSLYLRLRRIPSLLKDVPRVNYTVIDYADTGLILLECKADHAAMHSQCPKGRPAKYLT